MSDFFKSLKVKYKSSKDKKKAKKAREAREKEKREDEKEAKGRDYGSGLGNFVRAVGFAMSLKFQSRINDIYKQLILVVDKILDNKDDLQPDAVSIQTRVKCYKINIDFLDELIKWQGWANFKEKKKSTKSAKKAPTSYKDLKGEEESKKGESSKKEAKDKESKDESSDSDLKFKEKLLPDDVRKRLKKIADEVTPKLKKALKQPNKDYYDEFMSGIKSEKDVKNQKNEIAKKMRNLDEGESEKKLKAFDKEYDLLVDVSKELSPYKSQFKKMESTVRRSLDRIQKYEKTGNSEKGERIGRSEEVNRGKNMRDFMANFDRTLLNTTECIARLYKACGEDAWKDANMNSRDEYRIREAQNLVIQRVAKKARKIFGKSLTNSQLGRKVASYHRHVEQDEGKRG